MSTKTQKERVPNSMKTSKKLIVTALALAALTAGAWAENPPSAAPAAKDAAAAPAPPTVTAADVQALRDALAAQQLQIDRLTKQLDRQQAQQSAMEAASKSDTRPVPQQQVAEVASGISVQQDIATPSPNPQDASPNASPMEGPLTIHFRGINITPGGYAEAPFVRRSRALSADLSTPFNSVTMPGASQSQVPEFFGSGRQSKITTFVNGRLKDVELSSYVSADFLSAGVTSTSTSTNSYTLRLRQAWAQAKFDNGWRFLGGQSWSLATEDGKGIAIDDDMGKTADVRPKTIDPSYNVGFNFARQYGIRLTKTFNDKVAVAFAVENPQGTLTTHGNASNFLLGESGASNSYNTTATYTFNPSPDLIAKIAFDPGFGHYEVFGLVDRFTDRVFPCVEFEAGNPLCTATGATPATGAFNASKEGGGVGASARWGFFDKHVTFGLKGFGGSGVGRYGPGGLSDASINPDGTLHLVKNLMGLATLEFHTKKFDVYGYGGTEYAGRSYNFDPLASAGAGANVGYGAPTFKNTGCYTEVAPGSGGL